MKVQPYLNFDGHCDEAIAFYRKALGAEVSMLMRYKDAPMPDGTSQCGPDPAHNDKVMHASVQIGDSILGMSDGRCQGKANFQGISLTMILPDLPKAEKAFAGLAADGGQVQMPLNKTFFSPGFGMVADRFGVNWMVMVGQ